MRLSYTQNMEINLHVNNTCNLLASSTCFTCLVESIFLYTETSVVHTDICDGYNLRRKINQKWDTILLLIYEEKKTHIKDASIALWFSHSAFIHISRNQYSKFQFTPSTL